MTQHNRMPAEKWLETLYKGGKSPHTIAAYRRALAHFLQWHEIAYAGLAFDLASVLPRDIRDWKAHQQRVEKASPASVNQRLVALNQLFGWAQQQGLVHSNPAQHITALRVDRLKPHALKASVLRRLLRVAQVEARDYAMIEMLVGTGVRVGELLSLTCADVELRERSGKVIVRDGKGGQYREIPLTLDCRQALQTYLDTNHPDPANPHTPLWMGKKGPLSHRSSVMRMLHKYGAVVGIRDLHPHMLRHTFANRYLRANPDDVRGLARLLGHANLNTVMIYTEPDLDDLAQRMERMELIEGEAL